MLGFSNAIMVEPYLFNAKINGDSTNYWINLEFMFKEAYWYTPTTHYGLWLPRRHKDHIFLHKYQSNNSELKWFLGSDSYAYLNPSALRYLHQKQKKFSENDLIKISPNVLKLMADILRNPNEYQRELNAMSQAGSPILEMLQCAPLRPAIFQATVDQVKSKIAEQYEHFRFGFNLASDVV